jgi:phosphatidylinositol-3-phosphatase
MFSQKCVLPSTLTVILLILASAFLLSSSIPASAQVTVPLSNHVVLIIDENTSFTTVYPTGMPWLVGEGNKYGYSNNFFSNISGSLLDYLWLASGSSELGFGCNGNDCTSAITDENIFHLMSIAPLSWKVYVVSYLNAGGTITAGDGARGTHYYKRHNGAPWYSHIITNANGSQGQIVDFEQFGIDVANGTLPRYSIIVPDGTYDRHDGTLTQADNFLKNNLTALLALPDFQVGGSGLLVITFDNGDGDGQGKVYTTLIGPNVKPAYISNVFYQHQNTLRSMLDSLGIHTYPGGSNGAADESDFFTSTSGGVAIDSPANNSIQGTNVLVKAAASENGRVINRLEVWDTTTNVKLGDFPGTTVNQIFTFTPGTHALIVQDVDSGNGVYHKEYATITVSSSNGVFVTEPAVNSTQSGKLMPLSAYAVETTPIDRIEVWDNGIKLGDSPKGSTVAQWYPNLSAGAHALTVQDIGTNGAIIHKSIFNYTASTANAVYVNAPVNNSSQTGTTVHVNAYASEYNSSSVLIDHMEVWDNTHGVKLANSPTGTGLTSLFIDQNVTLGFGVGTYQLAILDVNASGFTAVHTTYVTITIH